MDLTSRLTGLAERLFNSIFNSEGILNKRNFIHRNKGKHKGNRKVK
jgi:hypothetical protein